MHTIPSNKRWDHRNHKFNGIGLNQRVITCLFALFGIWRNYGWILYDHEPFTKNMYKFCCHSPCLLCCWWDLVMLHILLLIEFSHPCHHQVSLMQLWSLTMIPKAYLVEYKIIRCVRTRVCAHMFVYAGNLWFMLENAGWTLYCLCIQLSKQRNLPQCFYEACWFSLSLLKCLLLGNLNGNFSCAKIECIWRRLPH